MVVACAPRRPDTAARAAAVRPGIEALIAESLHLVRGQRIGLLSNQTGIDRLRRRDVDLLLGAEGVRLTALFSPEHGFRGAEDRTDLPDATDSVTGLPIYSVYTGTRAPTISGLDTIDVLVVDLQDIGARYYTYVATAVVLARAAAGRGRRVIVLDRPNPVGGEATQGNVQSEPAPVGTLVGLLPVPMRHGLTFGEMMAIAGELYGFGGALTIVPAAGWRRPMYFDATGLPWVRPSPNMPDLESALHYPGTCLFEGTNLSVGRGTPFAYQVVGAPWLDPDAVVRTARAAGEGKGDAFAGVRVSTVRFTPRAPTDGKYDGLTLRGVRLRVTDRRRYDPTRTAVALLVALRDVHGDSLAFRTAAFDRLAGGPELRDAVASGRSAA
ncbi:MAG: exo-beta-N-acetylmuramidase NamZ family protein, partial [Gemmatimonadales bacterium]